MAVKSAETSMRVEVKTEWLTGSTKVTSETAIEDRQVFTDGAAASQFEDLIEVSLNVGTPVALSSLVSPAGASGSSFTKLKGVAFENLSSNAAITFTSTITGLVAGRIEPGVKFFVPYPSAAGLTISGASTLTASGTAGQSLRVILFVA